MPSIYAFRGDTQSLDPETSAQLVNDFTQNIGMPVIIQGAPADIGYTNLLLQPSGEFVGIGKAPSAALDVNGRASESGLLNVSRSLKSIGPAMVIGGLTVTGSISARGGPSITGSAAITSNAIIVGATTSSSSVGLLRSSGSTSPTSFSSSGLAGQVAYDAGHIYVCTGGQCMAQGGSDKLVIAVGIGI